ncbi:MAG: hypothetical protein J6T37_05190 [Bacteroidales bacterium]|nr:hypothetical protein [Bacteroidales bacterium]
MNNNCVVYIGNGFDVACGFKTRYSQFLGSEIFHDLLKKSKLAQWIEGKYKKDNDKWSDLEELLYYYSLHICNDYSGTSRFQEETKVFKIEHRTLTLALQNYIANQTSSDGNGFIPSLIETWQSCFDINTVCCFNYTPYVVTQKLLYDYIKLSRIHGELMPSVIKEDVKIKLGIDRCMKVCKEHEFLYKDKMDRYGFGIWTKPDKKLNAAANIVGTPLHPTFSDSDYIIVYGCSLGRSDTAYFKYLFENIDKQMVLLYHFGAKEKNTMSNKIKELAPKLDIDRNIIFIDSSRDNGYQKDLQQRIERHNILYSLHNCF